MGAGSVAGAAFIVPWLRARFSLESITLRRITDRPGIPFMALARQTRSGFCCRRASRGGTDAVGFRAMGGCAAHFAQLGATPAEPHTDRDDLAGGMAVGGVIWGFRCHDWRS